MSEEPVLLEELEKLSVTQPDSAPADVDEEDSGSGEDQPGTYSMETQKLALLIQKIATDCDVQNLLMVQEVACQLKCDIDAVKQELWCNMDLRKDLHKPVASWVVDQWNNTNAIMAENIAKGNAKKVDPTTGKVEQ